MRPTKLSVMYMTAKRTLEMQKESLLIIAPNEYIRMNDIEVKINKIQQKNTLHF